jgi:pimeloyl-ACP methyl ester carboxylesterase
MNPAHSIVATLLMLLSPLVAAAQGAGPAAPSSCRGEPIDIGGRRLWVDAEGTGDVTVAFEAGGGNDSSVWAQIAPRIRAAGVRTFVYDRAGLGRSELGPTPYSIQDEVHALRAALTACGINGPVILTAHSYGGVISLLTASTDKRVAGLVLVDALVPRATPKSEVEAILAKYRPQYDEIRKQAPELAKAMIPLMEAYPATMRALDAVRVPTRLPITDIVAENTTIDTPQTTALWRKAHAEFVAHNRFRKSLFAAGSSHKVMQDKPDLVVDAILQMIARVRR